ncbi:hypothetical protein ATANTOWER_029434, partial [Ataeniobius toweri]|nr:hypothetical protein [Ataeniobius toweri]
EKPHLCCSAEDVYQSSTESRWTYSSLSGSETVQRQTGLLSTRHRTSLVSPERHLQVQLLQQDLQNTHPLHHVSPSLSSGRRYRARKCCTMTVIPNRGYSYP